MIWGQKSIVLATLSGYGGDTSLCPVNSISTPCRTTSLVIKTQKSTKDKIPYTKYTLTKLKDCSKLKFLGLNIETIAIYLDS